MDASISFCRAIRCSHHSACRFFAVADDVRPGYQAIRGTVELTSSASEEQLQTLREVVNAHCPVLDILTNPVPVALELRITEAVAG